MADKYIPDLAQRLGLTYVPWARTFKTDQQSSKGTAIGTRNKFVLALALVSAGNNRTLGVAIRFPAMSNVTGLQEDLKNLPGFKSFSGRKSLKVTAKGVAVGWPFALKKPKPEEVIAFVDSLLAAVAKYAAPFDEKCEDCHSAAATEIVLKNGEPGYHCLGCQERQIEEQRRVEQEYGTRSANYFLALPAGVGAALGMGIVWGLFVGFIDGDGQTWTPKLHLLGAFVIGAAVSYIFFKTAGKVERVGQVLAVLLTLAGKWWADSIYYAMIATHQRVSAITPALLTDIIRQFWELKLSAEMSWLVLAGDVGFSVFIAWLPWSKVPKFVPVFQPISGSGQSASAAHA